MWRNIPSLLGLVLCTLVAVSPAHADDKDDARALAAEGITLFEEGQHTQAIERLKRADELFRAPVHRVYVGRALSKLGRLLDAEAAYEGAASMPVATDEPASFEPSRAAARTELAAVRARIPTIVIEHTDHSDKELRVLLDDRPVDRGDWSGVRVDPGDHVIAFQLGDGPTATEELTAAEGSESIVRVNVVGGDTVTIQNPGPDHFWPGLAFGVGGLGLVLGVVTGAIALKKAADVDGECPDGVCASSDALEDAGTADTLGSVALASLIVGGVGVALGVTLLLVDGSDSATEVSVTASPGGLRVVGRF